MMGVKKGGLVSMVVPTPFPFYENAPKELVESCNLCGSRLLKLIGLRDRYGFEAPHVRCQECGLVFLSLRMTAEAYREFYEAGHYRELIGAFTHKAWDNAKIASDQVRYAKFLSSWLSLHLNGQRGGLLLDIGGSTGVIAEQLALDHNFDATVVEPSVSEAAAARNRGLAVANVSLENYEAGGNHYDLVVLCRSVDHLLDIKAALKRIRQLVAPGGLFFVDFVRDCSIKIDHPFHLTDSTMTRFLESAGFRVKARNVPNRAGLNVMMLCEGV
jgi:SAM-dependent methyltransferase